MCALALLVAIACRGDVRERSESPTEQPEIFSSVPLPTSTPHPTATPDPAKLCRAVSRGRVGEVKRLIAANADVGARLCSGNPPLYTAIRYEEPEIARILVDAGADVNAIDKYDNPLLYTAVKEEEPEIVRILVDAGADVNTRTSSDNPLLYTAVREEEPEIVRILVDAGADVNTRTSSDNPLLYTAVREEEPEIVRILVDAGADVNARDPSGNPILYRLIWWGRANMVRILVDAGADVNARNSSDDPLIHTATTADRSGPEMVRILVDAGAEVDFPPWDPNIKVIDRSDSSLTVWVTGGGAETYYAVRRRNATESGEWLNMEVRYTDGRFEDRGLNAGSTYYYALQACNAVGCSKLSSETGGVTESTALVETPVAPSLDGERVRDLTAASLSWNQTAGATYYEVYQDDELDAKISAPGTTHVDFSPNSSFMGFSWAFTKTTYRVKACNKAGCSPFSNSVTLP